MYSLPLIGHLARARMLPCEKFNPAEAGLALLSLSSRPTRRSRPDCFAMPWALHHPGDHCGSSRSTCRQGTTQPPEAEKSTKLRFCCAGLSVRRRDWDRSHSSPDALLLIRVLREGERSHRLYVRLRCERTERPL